MGCETARPPSARREARARGDDLERVGIKALDPTVDGARLLSAHGDGVAERVELAGVTAQQHVGGEGVGDGLDPQSLAGADPETRYPLRAAPAPGAAILAVQGRGQ